MARKAQAALHGVEPSLTGRDGARLSAPPPDEHRDDERERDGVEEENGERSGRRNHESTRGGRERAREVDGETAKRHGLRQIASRNTLRDNGLPEGCVERRTDAH